ncbi:hypothetical protein [Streptomyces sp. NPDC056660]|uniref:hypothetical protein n=1 Tax=Streptomyces sp. NPDC056660 TaxID=3345897 RepID=UPI00367E2339
MDRVKQLPLDDWNDQDLLTRDEAAERLDEEMKAVTGELAELRRAGQDPAVRAGIELLDRRLAAMKAARTELSGS